MKCDEARASYLAGEASRSELAHLSTCAACGEHMTALESTRSILEDPALWAEPSADTEERLVALITGAPEAAVAPPRQRRLRRWVGAGVAAAAVVAAVLWIGLQPAAPDWQVALPGTANAPDARGIVSGWNEAAGTRVLLEVELAVIDVGVAVVRRNCAVRVLVFGLGLRLHFAVIDVGVVVR